MSSSLNMQQLPSLLTHSTTNLKFPHSTLISSPPPKMSSRLVTRSASHANLQGGRAPNVAVLPDVPTAVAQLLEATQQLQDALRRWSMLTLAETEVSNVYVKVGNKFNVTVAAFSAHNIDMRDVLSFPNDLRGVLEACLSEDPTPQTLERYLPRIRQIIADLLVGLRSKQGAYWQAANSGPPLPAPRVMVTGLTMNGRRYY